MPETPVPSIFPTKSAVQAHPGGSGLYRIDAPGAQWQSLYGSGLGSVDALTVDPRNANTVYAIGVQVLFRPSDAGATWSSLKSSDVPLTALVVDPSASNVLYAGTRGEGIFKTTDGGSTWTAMNNGTGPFPDGTLNAYQIWIDPRQPSVLFASTYPGLARSTDGGRSWQTNLQLGQFSGVGTWRSTPPRPA